MAIGNDCTTPVSERTAQDAPNHAVGVPKKARSPQSKQLRRKLSFLLARDWVVYTVVFVLLALFLNVTLIPRIADRVADATSDWHTWNFADYPLETCLNILGASFVATAPSMEEAALEAQYLGQLEQDGSFEEISAIVSAEREASGNIMEDILLQEYDADSQVAEEQDGSSSIMDPTTTALIVRVEDGYYYATTLRELQNAAIGSIITAGAPDSTRDWQILTTEDGFEARDLSIYYMIKQFKIPVALGLYLLGCIFMIFRGYGRAMRYFDELTGAVGTLIADRERPIKLSPALSLTQDELNAIRLSSLADERTAEYAERRKDELVAYLAHDMKTPLTSVMGYLMLLSEVPDMPADQRQRYINVAAEKAQRLERLMDEFFEITRYNLQAIPIERATIDIGLLCAQVADEFFPDAHARGINIVVSAPEGLTVFVDAEKFARALGNVVRNAVAYADKDTEVKLSAVREASNCCIQVTNKGREISEVHLKSIFEKFYREDVSRTTSSGGAGLGLAIAKEIVTAHGGTISATSEAGYTVFTITVPV